MARMFLYEVLMFVLRLKEPTKSVRADNVFTCPTSLFLTLRQIGASRLPLPCIRGEKRAAILGSVIGALMIKRGGVGNNRKENPHQVTIADDIGIISEERKSVG